jgi:hypothetical protein
VDGTIMNDQIRRKLGKFTNIAPSPKKIRLPLDLNPVPQGPVNVVHPKPEGLFIAGGRQSFQESLVTVIVF